MARDRDTGPAWQQPAMTTLLDRMAADGLVRRQRDGRQTCILLTRAGAEASPVRIIGPSA